MPAGKLAAQAGHAYLDAYTNSLFADLQRSLREEANLHAFLNATSFRDFGQAVGFLSSLEYMGDKHGTKVCLKAKNLNQLLRAKEEAERAGLPCALITDSGHILPPHFDGNPIITALGIGPARRDQITHITRRFSLV